MNAFSSLVIDGLVKIDSVDVSLTCFKGISNPPKPVTTSITYFARAGGLPARLPSKLPPPGDLCLRVSVTPEPLGHGRVGSVYPVKLDDTVQNFLPPLVMKVAARRRSENLAREAWFYEEMENIQGASIARCYGFFTAEIDSNSKVLGWAESDARYNPDEEHDILDEGDDFSDEDDHIPEYKGEGTTKEDSVRGWPETYTRYNPDEEDNHLDQEADSSDEADYFPEDKDEGTMKEDPVIISNRTIPPSASDDNERTFISVLVLERLGDLIPMLVSLKDIKFAPSLFFLCACSNSLLYRPDIHEIYSDLGQFGVEQVDVRWSNILASPTPQYNLVCPYHGYKHHWRVVDFDRSRKSNFTLDQIEGAQGSRIEILLSGLTNGLVVEPWD
jgi:hypothetical protein